jgi:hypothetical protein
VGRMGISWRKGQGVAESPVMRSFVKCSFISDCRGNTVIRSRTVWNKYVASVGDGEMPT